MLKNIKLNPIIRDVVIPLGIFVRRPRKKESNNQYLVTRG